MVENYKAKISLRNQEPLKNLNNLLKTNKILGIVDVTSLPAPQFQKIRKSLKGQAEVFIVKRNLIEIFFKQAEKTNKNVSKLLDNSNGIIGLIFTSENPFKIFKIVNKNKSKAPAKAGQTAPNEIVVPAGPTNFSPGPIIGELGALKIKAGINAGKVEIKEDSVVAKEGDEISFDLASVLTRLGINPMEVGLNIKSLYESGVIYDKKVLDVDETEFMNDLKSVISRSNSLALGIGYVTPQNVKLLISKASRISNTLADKTNYACPKTITKLIGKSHSHGVGLKNKTQNK